MLDVAQQSDEEIVRMIRRLLDAAQKGSPTLERALKKIWKKTLDETSLEEWLRRLKKASDEALQAMLDDALNSLWDTLFQRLERTLYPIAFDACNRNFEDTKDLLQEIRITLLTSISNYKEKAAFKSYAVGVAMHVRSAWFRKKARKIQTVDVLDDEGLDILDSVPSTSPSPDAALLEEELVANIHERLRPEELKIIRLRYERDLPHDEIAEELGIQPGAARTRLHRAMKALLEIVQDHRIASDKLTETAKRLFVCNALN